MPGAARGPQPLRAVARLQAASTITVGGLQVDRFAAPIVLIAGMIALVPPLEALYITPPDQLKRTADQVLASSR